MNALYHDYIADEYSIASCSNNHFYVIVVFFNGAIVITVATAPSVRKKQR